MPHDVPVAFWTISRFYIQREADGNAFDGNWSFGRGNSERSLSLSPEIDSVCASICVGQSEGWDVVGTI